MNSIDINKFFTIYSKEHQWYILINFFTLHYDLLLIISKKCIIVKRNGHTLFNVDEANQNIATEIMILLCINNCEKPF